MQDKLIEAVAKAIFNRRNPKCPNPWEEIANDHLKEEYRADAIAAVRAHDAQLDAEDPAEPVEDVVGRMCKAFGKNGISPYIWRDEMTAAFVEARKGYYSQQDMEKAILAQARGFQVIPVDELPEFLKQALAPKPSLAEEIAAVLKRHEYKVTSHTALAAEIAALFPKTGGAK